jgi:hypothetical protein
MLNMTTLPKNSINLTKLKILNTDRWTLLPLMICFGIVFLLWSAKEFDRILPLSLPLFLIIVIFLFVLFLVLCIGACRDFYRGRWRRATSIVGAPVVAIALFLSLARLEITPDYVRLKILKTSYLAEVNKTVPSGEPLLKLWNWGETGGVSVMNVFYTLVYDDSDEIFLPSIKRSSSWNQRANTMAKGTELFSILQIDRMTPNIVDLPRLTIKRLDGHFYLVTEYM